MKRGRAEEDDEDEVRLDRRRLQVLRQEALKSQARRQLLAAAEAAGAPVARAAAPTAAVRGAAARAAVVEGRRRTQSLSPEDMSAPVLTAAAASSILRRTISLSPAAVRAPAAAVAPATAAAAAPAPSVSRRAASRASSAATALTPGDEVAAGVQADMQLEQERQQRADAEDTERQRQESERQRAWAERQEALRVSPGGVGAADTPGGEEEMEWEGDGVRIAVEEEVEEAPGTPAHRPEVAAERGRTAASDRQQSSRRRQEAERLSQEAAQDQQSPEGIRASEEMMEMMRAVPQEYLVVYSRFEYMAPWQVELMFVAMNIQVCTVFPVYIQITPDGRTDKRSQRLAVRVQLPSSYLRENALLRAAMMEPMVVGGADAPTEKGGGLLEQAFTVEIGLLDQARKLPTIAKLISAAKLGKANVLFTSFDMGLQLGERTGLAAYVRALQKMFKAAAVEKDPTTGAYCYPRIARNEWLNMRVVSAELDRSCHGGMYTQTTVGVRVAFTGTVTHLPRVQRVPSMHEVKQGVLTPVAFQAHDCVDRCMRLRGLRDFCFFHGEPHDGTKCSAAVEAAARLRQEREQAGVSNRDAREVAAVATTMEPQATLSLAAIRAALMQASDGMTIQCMRGGDDVRTVGWGCQAIGMCERLSGVVCSVHRDEGAPRPGLKGKCPPPLPSRGRTQQVVEAVRELGELLCRRGAAKDEGAERVTEDEGAASAGSPAMGGHATGRTVRSGPAVGELMPAAGPCPWPARPGGMCPVPRCAMECPGGVSPVPHCAAGRPEQLDCPMPLPALHDSCVECGDCM